MCDRENLAIYYRVLAGKGHYRLKDSFYLLSRGGGKSVYPSKYDFLSQQCEAGWASKEKQRAACHQ